MANGYGSNGSNGNRMGMRRTRPSRPARRSEGNVQSNRRMGRMASNTGRRFQGKRSTGQSKSHIIANGKKNGVQQWLQCEGQTITSTCKDVTDQYNISLYSGKPYRP
tara:strand:+ start:720 stop:1040 length:321 start_codon:yes stop_codon:yes gene_type:complete